MDRIIVLLLLFPGKLLVARERIGSAWKRCEYRSPHPYPVFSGDRGWLGEKTEPCAKRSRENLPFPSSPPPLPSAGNTEKSKPRFSGNPTQTPRIKKIFLEHILRPIRKPISSLSDHFGIGVKMTSKNIWFTLGFWVELPQILGLGFPVQQLPSTCPAPACSLARAPP